MKSWGSSESSCWVTVCAIALIWLGEKTSSTSPPMISSAPSMALSVTLMRKTRSSRADTAIGHANRITLRSPTTRL